MFILDCTLRDGGYYNSWDFEPELVRAYLEAMVDSGVDLVELGLRNFPADSYRGAHYYSSEAYLDRLNLPKGVKYGVMIDAKTILSANQTIDGAVNELFLTSSSSSLSFVRLACHFDEVTEAEKICVSLYQLGYEVIINLMQVSTRTQAELSNTIESINSWVGVKGIYFADSLGNMDTEDIERVISTIQQSSGLPIGIHAHNNMGQAIRNSLAAISRGVVYVDCTVGGMGRGAGNAETEILIAELEIQGASKYKLKGLSKLYVQYFENLKELYGWGPSIYYYLAARHNIHPSYIQSLLTDPHYGPDERALSFEQLKFLAGRTKYDSKALLGALEDNSAEDFIAGCKHLHDLSLNGNSNVLLLGSGASVDRYIADIKVFISQSAMKVACVNQGRDSSRSLVDYFFFSHNTRSLDYPKFFNREHGDFIVPLTRFSNIELEGVSSSDLTNYAVSTKSGEFSALASSCVLPFDLTVGYAIAALISLGVNNIFMAGFDGYDFDDERNKEMIELIQVISKKYPELRLISLTPTQYPLIQSSIYAQLL